MVKKFLRLTKGQHLFFASTLKTIAEATIIGSSAAFLLPESFQLKESIQFSRYLLISLVGLMLVIIGSILVKIGEND